MGLIPFLSPIRLSNRMLRTVASRSVRAVSIPTKPAYRDLDPETRELYKKIIRVDHAGERGADVIYQGQYDVLKNTDAGPKIKEMWEQEKEHLAAFEKLLVSHRTAPTVLLPLWDVLGYAVGAGTAMMGKEAAMACTVAVEDTIIGHYNDQIRELLKRDPQQHAEMIKLLSKFRDEEQEHHDIGLDEGAEQAPAYQLLTNAIKLGCKVAIAVSNEI